MTATKKYTYVGQTFESLAHAVRVIVLPFGEVMSRKISRVDKNLCKVMAMGTRIAMLMQNASSRDIRRNRRIRTLRAWGYSMLVTGTTLPCGRVPIGVDLHRLLPSFSEAGLDRPQVHPDGMVSAATAGQSSQNWATCVHPFLDVELSPVRGSPKLNDGPAPLGGGGCSCSKIAQP